MYSSLANDQTSVQQLLIYKLQLTRLKVQKVTVGVREAKNRESSLEITLLGIMKKAGKTAIGSYIKTPLLVLPELPE